MIKQSVEDFKNGLATQTTEDIESAIAFDDGTGNTVEDIPIDQQVPLDEPLQNFVSYVPDIPSQQEVEQKLLQAKKMELLKQYASDQMIQQAEESRRILGYSEWKKKQLLDSLISIKFEVVSPSYELSPWPKSI